MGRLFNALKRSILGVATGQLISGYKKDKGFKSKVDAAKGLDKLKIAWEYLVSTNKELIDETNLDSVVKNVKQTTGEARKQIKQLDTKKMISKAKTQRNSIVAMLQEKIVSIEAELVEFEDNAKEYAEDKRIEYYRQLSSKFALFKKTVTKYALQWALAAEEKFDVEQKIKFIGEKLDQLKSQAKNSSKGNGKNQQKLDDLHFKK